MGPPKAKPQRASSSSRPRDAAAHPALPLLLALLAGGAAWASYHALRWTPAPVPAAQAGVGGRARTHCGRARGSSEHTRTRTHAGLRLFGGARQEARAGPGRHWRSAGACAASRRARSTTARQRGTPPARLAPQPPCGWLAAARSSSTQQHRPRVSWPPHAARAQISTPGVQRATQHMLAQARAIQQAAAARKDLHVEVRRRRWWLAPFVWSAGVPLHHCHHCTVAQHGAPNHQPTGHGPCCCCGAVCRWTWSKCQGWVGRLLELVHTRHCVARGAALQARAGCERAQPAACAVLLCSPVCLAPTSAHQCVCACVHWRAQAVHMSFMGIGFTNAYRSVGVLRAVPVSHHAVPAPAPAPAPCPPLHSAACRRPFAPNAATRAARPRVRAHVCAPVCTRVQAFRQRGAEGHTRGV